MLEYTGRKRLGAAVTPDGRVSYIPEQEAPWYRGVVDAARVAYRTIGSVAEIPLYLFSRTKPQGGHNAKQRGGGGKNGWTQQGKHTSENPKAKKNGKK